MRDHTETGMTTAALLAEAAGLGPVRVLFRSCGGFVEIFCAAGAFEVAGGWINLRRDGVHLHLRLPDVAGASLHEAGDDAHPERPSVWLHGACGTPVLLLVLDQTHGPERERQESVFRALRARWGAQVVFGRRQKGREERVLH